MGMYCLNRTQPGGIYVGTSNCTWVYRKGTHGIVPQIRDDQWGWYNQSGMRHRFSHFWSSTNNTLFTEAGGKKCIWRPDAGAWKCKWCKDESITGNGWNCNVLGHPFGPLNTTYFQAKEHVNELTNKWNGPFENGSVALKGHYWICGHYAYKRLPANWTGVCYVGVIRPMFFLLPGKDGSELGVRVYDDLNRHRRSIDTSLTRGSGQTWGKDDWPPQRIIKHYGPATWNPNEWISGAREPIYNLNRIIRLQAILEIITNETAYALDLLADQASQMRAAILQHRIVLDYLLAEEGGVCGKLNDSTCCLKIDDNGKVVKQISQGIRKIAHVPVQTWKSPDLDLFSWLPGGPWVKRILFYLLCAVVTLMFVPCMIPCFIQLIQRVVSSMYFVTSSTEGDVKHIRGTFVTKTKKSFVTIV